MASPLYVRTLWLGSTEYQSADFGVDYFADWFVFSLASVGVSLVDPVFFRDLADVFQKYPGAPS